MTEPRTPSPAADAAVGTPDKDNLARRLAEAWHKTVGPWATDDKGTASLVGPAGAADPSRVPPGSYRLKARTSDGKDVELGTVNVTSGAVISVACGFGTCKRE